VKIETVGILGFGRFGSMIYRYLKGRCKLFVYDPDPEKIAAVDESRPFSETLKADLLILSVPISAIKGVCRKLAPYLKSHQVVVDTCSVKERPVRWMEDELPAEVGILGTHPLFGPDSGKDGIAGLKIALCPVRIKRDHYERICDFLRTLELVLVETTPEEHDRQIALSQAIFHLIAQAMKQLEWGVKPISTPGPESFYRLVKTVQRDTNQLFHDMERENPYAAEYRQEFINEILRLDRELKSRRQNENEPGS
jgi:prephenate dehydrogenase